MIIGGWARRRSVDFGPFFAYAAILFAFSAIVSAVHVPGGTFIHSAIALAPHAYILALEGIAVAVAWIAARRPRWNVDAATRLFTASSSGSSSLAAILGALSTSTRTWDGVRVDRKAVAAALDLAGAAAGRDRIMSIDAAGYRYWTGRGGRRQRQRPARHDPPGRRGLRDRVARRRAGRLGPGARAGRRPAPGRRGSARRSSRSRARTGSRRRSCYPVCVSPRTSAARRSRRARRRLARSVAP